MTLQKPGKVRIMEVGIGGGGDDIKTAWDNVREPFMAATFTAPDGGYRNADQNSQKYGHTIFVVCVSRKDVSYYEESKGSPWTRKTPALKSKDGFKIVLAQQRHDPRPNSHYP